MAAATVANWWTSRKRLWSILYLLAALCFLLMGCLYQDPWIVIAQVYMLLQSAVGFATTFHPKPRQTPASEFSRNI